MAVATTDLASDDGLVEDITKCVLRSISIVDLPPRFLTLSPDFDAIHAKGATVPQCHPQAKCPVSPSTPSIDPSIIDQWPPLKRRNQNYWGWDWCITMIERWAARRTVMDGIARNRNRSPRTISSRCHKRAPDGYQTPEHVTTTPRGK